MQHVMGIKPECQTKAQPAEAGEHMLQVPHLQLPQTVLPI